MQEFHPKILDSHSAEVTDKFFDKGVGTSPHTTALKRNRSQWGQQFEASSRNDAEELQLLCTQNLAQTLSSWLHSHFLLTRTTLNLLKSWTNSSTRESGHHHTQPLWKEIGLNGDNSPKQAAGTMRKNCSFCALKTLRNLCPADFIHPFYSHSYDSHSAEVTDKFFDKGVGTSQQWQSRDVCSFSFHACWKHAGGIKSGLAARDNKCRNLRASSQVLSFRMESEDKTSHSRWPGWTNKTWENFQIGVRISTRWLRFKETSFQQY